MLAAASGAQGCDEGKNGLNSPAPGVGKDGKTIFEEMATHSSVLAWRIPGTGEPDGWPSLGSHKVGHD